MRYLGQNNIVLSSADINQIYTIKISNCCKTLIVVYNPSVSALMDCIFFRIASILLLGLEVYEVDRVVFMCLNPD